MIHLRIENTRLGGGGDVIFSLQIHSIWWILLEGYTKAGFWQKRVYLMFLQNALKNTKMLSDPHEKHFRAILEVFWTCFALI